MEFSNIIHETIGQVSNPAKVVRTIDVPRATVILGTSAICAFIGNKVGGPMGMAVGALIGDHLGRSALGEVRSLKVSINGFGMVEIEYQYEYAQ